MSKIIAVCNNKGGVGKTHTVVHLSGALAEVGHRVLVVDLDPQANLTRLFLHELKRPTVYDVLVHQVPLAQAVRLTSFQRIDLVAADARLEHLGQRLHDERDKHIRLDSALHEHERLAGSYDVVVLDCPPNLGASTTNALASADGVVIPLEADQFSVDGLQRLLALIEQMRPLNSRLAVEGVLISLYNGRRAIERTIAETLRASKRVRVFDVHIKDSAKYRESITARMPITYYKPASEQAEAFRRLAESIYPGAAAKTPTNVSALAYAERN